MIKKQHHLNTKHEFYRNKFTVLNVGRELSTTIIIEVYAG